MLWLFNLLNTEIFYINSSKKKSYSARCNLILNYFYSEETFNVMTESG